MSRRLVRLTSEQIAELMLSHSDDSESELSEESGSDEDVLYEAVPEPDSESEARGLVSETEPADDAATAGPSSAQEGPTSQPDEEAAPSGPASLRQAHSELTRSQAKLERAELHVQQQEARTYTVSTRKDGIVAEWSTSCPSSVRRRDPANILTERGGVNGAAARAANTERDYFSLFINDEVMSDMLEATNRKLLNEREAFRTASKVTTQVQTGYLLNPVSRAEMDAFLGLCILRGQYKNLTTAQLFNPATGPALFKATMGEARFKTLLRHVSFDDASTRGERRKRDKMAPIRETFNKFEKTLREHFKPGPCITIDETLLKFRGRCPFRVFMKSKPGKYGILIRSVADADTRYFWKLWPYTGVPEDVENAAPGVVIKSVPELVHHLVEEVKGSGRNVTMDRYFTSVPLLEELREDRLTAVGTINAGRRFLPKELTDPRGRDPDTSIFAFRRGITMVSHCPKKGKVTLLVSSQHTTPSVDEVSKKPEMTLYYNATKGGVDVVDAMVDEYMGKPPLRRWPTAVLLFMLTVASVNGSSLKLLKEARQGHSVRHGFRKTFMMELGIQLVLPRIQERSAHPTGLNQPSLRAIESVISGREPGEVEEPVQGAEASAARPVRGRCHRCQLEARGAGYKTARGKLSKWAKECALCRRYVCSKHAEEKRVCKGACDAS